MKKVIVTGAAGFVGRQSLQPLLDLGYEVHAIDQNDLNSEFCQVHWHRIDLSDEAEVNSLLAGIRADSLLHFAWFTRHGEYWSSNENFKSLLSSYALLQSFAANGGKRVVMAGTCAEYAWNRGMCNELSSATLPTTVYGYCKLAMSNLLQAFAQAHDLSAAWGRLFFLFGPHENEKRFVASLIKNLLAGRDAPCSHGNQLRDFLSSIDAGAAFAALLASQVTGVVNIGGQPITLKKVAYLLEELCSRPGAVKFGQIETAADEPLSIVADTGRLNDEVGWRPAFTIEERLAQTVEWWKKHG